MLRKMLSAFAATLLILAIVAPVRAHFLWLVESENPKLLNLYFSEGPYADDPAILKRVADATALRLTDDGESQEIKFTL
ncbi:MAG: hypothetical protein ACIALR_07430, partial [Blastopirellula sp. JB062]